MYQRILADPLLFPQDMPHDAMTLITGLLQRDPAKRLGANGAEEIKRHPFFSKHIDWNRCVSMSISRGMGLLAGWPAAGPVALAIAGIDQSRARDPGRADHK